MGFSLLTYWKLFVFITHKKYWKVNIAASKSNWRTYWIRTWDRRMGHSFSNISDNHRTMWTFDEKGNLWDLLKFRQIFNVPKSKAMKFWTCSPKQTLIFAKTSAKIQKRNISCPLSWMLSSVQEALYLKKKKKIVIMVVIVGEEYVWSIKFFWFYLILFIIS